MSNVEGFERFALAFAYEGFRAFFRPKLKEPLELPLRDKHLFSEAELGALKNRVSPYWYLGAVIEVAVGTLLFLIGVGLAALIHRFGDGALDSLFTPKAWNGLVHGVSYGIAFVDIVLYFVFSMKVLHATLNRL